MQKKILAGIAVVLLLAIGYVAYDSMSGKLRPMQIDKDYVVYSIDDTKVTASEYYDRLDQENGDAVLGNTFVRLVMDNYPSSDEIKSKAAAQAANVITYYSQTYPENYKDVLGAALRASCYSGFDDLQAYMENAEKFDVMLDEYIMTNLDELKVRKINYLLIKFDNIEEGADHSTPTAEEKAKMDAVDMMLAEEGTTFEDVAREHSEDASTAPDGGYLGIIDAYTTSLDPAFTEAALSLKEDEVSDWVYSENFGWFRIKNAGSTPERFSEPENEPEEGMEPGSPFDSLIGTFDKEIFDRAIIATAEKYGVEFESDELKARVYKQFGVTGDVEITDVTDAESEKGE